MKIVAWNCRRLGNGPAVRGLLSLQKEDPDILFLSETKMDRNKIEGLRWRLGLTNMVVKDCSGKSGGLAIFWRKGVNFQLRTVARLYIDGDVVEGDALYGASLVSMGSHTLTRRSSHGKLSGC
jgi:exonuclease III